MTPSSHVPPHALSRVACQSVVSLSALQINHTGEVVYRDSNVFGVVDNAVILECGATLPDLYIWSFTRPGSQTIKALVYNLGRGPRTQKLAEVIGQPRVTPNSAAVSIEKVPLAAQGLFTCQAFYDIDEEPVVFFYYVHLTVGGKGFIRLQCSYVLDIWLFSLCSSSVSFFLPCLTAFTCVSLQSAHLSCVVAVIRSCFLSHRRPRHDGILHVVLFYHITKK